MTDQDHGPHMAAKKAAAIWGPRLHFDLICTPLLILYHHLSLAGSSHVDVYVHVVMGQKRSFLSSCLNQPLPLLCRIKMRL